LDKLSGPLTYDARAPEDIKFIPLNQQTEMDGNQLMQFYESHRRLSKYLHIIRDSPVYPVVLDSKSRVLSLPPIINGDHSKISLQTRNVFIECTATEEPKARTVLNMMVAMFSQYCKQPYT
jgi:phenylalanyl-tRNA synthetase beta chain